MNRNTDSMLEDVAIAGGLRRRLEIRRKQHSKRTTQNRGLSEFMMKEITERAGLDAVASSQVTDDQLRNAAELAIKAAMEGYFSNMGSDTLEEARNLFMGALRRQEFKAGDFICRQNDEGTKLYVLEEGNINFLVNGQVAGSAGGGSVFGELSLVYGVPRQADVRAMTDLICWVLDTLDFRRIQGVVARESLKTSKSKIFTKFGKQASSLSEEQEDATKVKNSIPFSELKRLSVVGQGTFGSVYIATVDSRPNESFALKRMSKASIVDRENEKRVVIEKNALQSMHGCPFIISLLGTYQDKDSIYFLTECVQGGNLISYMIDKDILSHSECLFFCACIARALIHCHGKGFIHRDMKPENCLIDRDGYIKLCDFGMAKRLPCTVIMPNGGTEVVRLAFTMCGTPEFMAPEFVLSTGYDKGVDWWALGCIIVEMYSGRAPFDFDRDLKKTFKAVCLIGMGRKKLDLPKHLQKKGLEEAASLSRALLTKASDRLGGENSAEVLEHPYFASLDKDELDKHKISAPYKPKIGGNTDSSNFRQDGEEMEDEEVEQYFGDSDWCKGF